jgi:ketosteroid isomerase-like protein
MKTVSGVLLILIALVSATAQTSDASAGVRDVVTTFEAALQAKDLVKIERLVSPGILVFENGYRNDGWPDFRDHHLIPEFRESTGSYTSSIVKIDVSGDMAWAYSRMDRAHARNNPEKPDVWTVYVLRRESSKWSIVVLNWSVRRVNE